MNALRMSAAARYERVARRRGGPWRHRCKWTSFSPRSRCCPSSLGRSRCGGFIAALNECNQFARLTNDMRHASHAPQVKEMGRVTLQQYAMLGDDLSAALGPLLASTARIPGLVFRDLHRGTITPCEPPL